MASFIQRNHGSNGGAAASLSVSFPAGITAGSIIIVAGLMDPATTGVTISNDKGDAVTTIIAPTTGTGNAFARYFCSAFLAPTTGAITVTATYSGTAAYGDLFIWEGAGLTSPIVDKQPIGAGTGAVGDSGSTGTLSAAVELAIAYGDCTNAMTSAGTGWSNFMSESVNTGSGAEERVTAATTAINGTMNTSGAGDGWDVLCVTFMSGAAAIPVRPPVGPVVEAPAYPIALRTWLNGPPRTSAAPRPPSPIMWRMIEGAPYPTALQTWTQRAQTIVLSVRPPPVYHYPVPRGAEYPFGLYTVVNQRVQFTPQRTVMNYDWPVPRTVDYPAALRTWASGPPRTTVAAMPPANYDYPVPRGSEYPIGLRSWIGSPPLTPNAVPPFRFDFSLSRGVEYPIDLRSAVNQRVQFLPAPAARPPATYDYPVPRSIEYPTALRTWVSGPTPISFPPLSYQFPLIRAAEYPIALRTWISQTTLTPGISYTLTASTGAYVLTGPSAILARGLTSALGSFAETGKAATFNIALTSARGVFSLTGNDATLTVTGSFTMPAGAGAFSLTGRDATLTVSTPLLGAIDGTDWSLLRRRRRRQKSSREELDELLADIIAEAEGPKPELTAKRAARRVVKRAKQDGRLDEIRRHAEQAEHKRLDQAELVDALVGMAQRHRDDEMAAVLLLLSH